MKSIKLIFTLSFLLSSSLYAQTFEWVKSIGSTNDDEGTSIDIDQLGNVYTIGFFKDSIDLNPGSSIDMHYSNGENDVFIQKLDSTGQYLWGLTFGGSFNDLGQCIHVDNQGNIFTTGQFNSSVDFDPGVGVNYKNSNGRQDVFVQKFDSLGNLLWVTSFGGLFNEYGNSIQTDPLGNVYISGGFSTTVDFNPGAGRQNKTSRGGLDIFIQKLDSAGNFIWSKTFGSIVNDYSYSICLDRSNNIYTIGDFNFTVDFDPNSGVSNKSSKGNNDVFIHKMDQFGNLLWVKTFGGTYDDVGRSIHIDNDGNVLSTGSFQDTVDFDPGMGVDNHISNGFSDIFIHKLDSLGNFIWSKSYGSSNSEFSHSIITDNTKSVYVTGGFDYTIDFDPGIGISTLTSNGQFDVFLQKFDSNGNFLLAKNFGGSGFDYGRSLKVGSKGEIYTTGTFDGTADFNPSQIGSFILNSNGLRDVFTHKMSQNITTNIWEEQLENDAKLTIYPNPTNGLFQIVTEGNLRNTQITITDVRGKVVNQMNHFNQSNTQLQIDGSSGIYFLHIKNQKKQSVVKIVKE